MIKNKQLFRHRPPETIGDCHRTAIACLLDLPPEAVPHFGAIHWQDPEEFHEAFERWLLDERWLRTVTVPYDCALDLLLAAVGSQNRGAYYLLGGRSRTGVNHTVVCRGGGIEWDPSLDGAGIVGPCSDGFYWVTFLVPAAMYAEGP